MITNFTVLCGTTVPNVYSWDVGTPLETSITQTTAYSTSEYISGYSPGLNVIFANRSASDENFEFITYDWDFGDFYHNINNKASLSCVSIIEHLYIMPGIYTVTLRHKQARQRSLLEINPYLCRGKFDIRWFWTELECTRETKRTWDETTCEFLSASVPPERWKPKWWDDEAQCFAKHCKFWSWYNLANRPGRANPVIWKETEADQRFEKKWMFEDNDIQCTVNQFSFLDTLEINEQQVSKTIVEVKEIPPVAQLTCITRPITGISPFTVQLSPSACEPGSFPIDRIDWDFGDGTPILTVTRFTPSTNPELIFTNRYFEDPLDVRNFDIIHTYTRTANTYSVFYPSLTCYSANTGTYDACSTTVGPILLPQQPDTKLLKTRNTLKGVIYAFDTNKENITFTTNTELTSLKINIGPNIPTASLKDGSNLTQAYYGYQGTDYPPEYIVICRDVPSTLPPSYLATEDDDPFDGDSIENTDELGLPLQTEGDFTFIP